MPQRQSKSNGGSEFARAHESFEARAESLFWIRDKAGAIIPWRLNRIQSMVNARKRADLEKGKLPRWLILKYRRGGMSTLEIGINFHRVSSWTGQSAVTLAHIEGQTAKLFRIAETLYLNLPTLLRPRRKAVNATEFDFPGLRSLYYMGTAGARGFGRGDTLQRVHWSEVAFSKPEAGLLPGLDLACSRGSMVLESTANGPSGLFFELCQKAFSPGRYSKWNGIFLPWFLDAGNFLPLESGEHIEPGEPHNEISAEYCQGEAELIEMAGRDWGTVITPEMLKWRRHEWAGTEPRPDYFFQEYPETWQGAFVAITGLFFDPRYLQAGASACPPPIVSEDQGRFLAWEEPRPGVRYYAGADTSEGLPDGDAQYLSIVDRERGVQVARWHGRVGISTFGGVVIPKYCQRYNRAVVGIERENHGHAVIQACRAAGYRRLFKHTTKIRGDRDGWSTNGQTRSLMLDNLRCAIQGEESADGWAVINDPVFWAEGYTFERQDNGKYEALPPNHDDAIMGHAIALEVRRLQPRPGITS